MSTVAVALIQFLIYVHTPKKPHKSAGGEKIGVSEWGRRGVCQSIESWRRTMQSNMDLEQTRWFGRQLRAERVSGMRWG